MEKRTTSSQESQARHQTHPSLGPELAEDLEDSTKSSLKSAPSSVHTQDPMTMATSQKGKVGDANSSTDWNKTSTSPWLMPHAVEYQKHAWYSSQLGMSDKKVKDEWGFSSASVSRSHTPTVGNA
jgi:hypothetical protein